MNLLNLAWPNLLLYFPEQVFNYKLYISAGND